MKSIHLRWAGVALLAAAIVLFALTQRKTITLSIDGHGQEQATYALTVGQFLSLRQIDVRPGDQLAPPLSHWLKSGDVIELDRAVPVVIWADGRAYTVVSAERTPSALLAQAGLSLNEGDTLCRDGLPILPQTPLSPGAAHTLQVQRAHTLTLHSEQGDQVIRTSAPTLAQALWQAGIVLRQADRLQPALLTPLTADLEVSLHRARLLKIISQDGLLSRYSAASTVGEALAEAGLALQGLDYSLPPAEAPLPADGNIRLVRVSETVLIEQTPLPFETLEQPLPEVELDTRQVVQAGAYGLTARRVRVRYEDGLETSRQIEDEWVAVPPQPRIVGYGTKVVMHTLESADGVITYWRALQFWVTSYHPSEGGGSLTASGQPVRHGVVGVDTAYIPLGTQLYIPGYGFAEAADTGGFRGRWIDLGYSDEDYVAWHQWVTVYFLWPPPAVIPYNIPPPTSISGYSPPAP